MTPEERAQKIKKVFKYLSPNISRMKHQPCDQGAELGIELDDTQISALVRLSGIAAKRRDNITVVRDALHGNEDALLRMINNVTVFSEGSDFGDVSTVLEIMEECGRTPEADPVHWEAHFLANSEYEPNDIRDEWSYKNNHRLISLIDSNPEAAEGILRLHERCGYQNLTQEVVDEYIGTHAAVADGFL